MSGEDPEIWSLVRQTDYVRREDGGFVAGPKTSAADEGEQIDVQTAHQIQGMIRRNNRIRGFAREQGIEDWDEAAAQYQDIKNRLEDADDAEKWRIRDEFSA